VEVLDEEEEQKGRRLLKIIRILKDVEILQNTLKNFMGNNISMGVVYKKNIHFIYKNRF
jgi:hypothetical protein